MKTTITKFNPKLHNHHLDAEENFQNQLKEVFKNDYLSEEYNEYLYLKLDYLKTRCESKYAEISLLEFQQERNHPDKDIYDDYDNPCYEYCEHLEELIKEVRTQIKQFNHDFAIKAKELYYDKKDKEVRELKVA